MELIFIEMCEWVAEEWITLLIPLRVSGSNKSRADEEFCKIQSTVSILVEVYISAKQDSEKNV